jgi:hypothetical protein
MTEFNPPIDTIDLLKRHRDKIDPRNRNARVINFILKNSFEKKYKKLSGSSDFKYQEIVIDHVSSYPTSYPAFATRQIKWSVFDFDHDPQTLFKKLQSIEEKCFVPKRYKGKQKKFIKLRENEGTKHIPVMHKCSCSMCSYEKTRKPKSQRRRGVKQSIREDDRYHRLF